MTRRQVRKQTKRGDKRKKDNNYGRRGREQKHRDKREEGRIGKEGRDKRWREGG